MARLRAMMARVDQILQGIERRLPGKEIWIAEWNSCGASPASRRGQTTAEPMSPAMGMLTTTRMALVHLRHPSLTASLFFRDSFGPRDPQVMFFSDGPCISLAIIPSSPTAKTLILAIAFNPPFLNPQK
jgi:hypothetical protein